jgi:hypothetical protein
VASTCNSCIYRGEDDFCIALAEDCEDVADEDCDCFSPIMETETDEG